jgi:hypothetical protein
MKKLITAAMSIMLLTGTAFSSPKNRTGRVETTKEVVTGAAFRNILVDDNIQLVLVPGDSKTSVTVAGDAAAVEEVSIAVKKNEMRISSAKHLKKGSVIVYVPAKDISYITLGSGASVSAKEYLNLSTLTVFLNVDSAVDLKTFGDITIKEANDCDVIYQKFEKAKVIRVAQ